MAELFSQYGDEKSAKRAKLWKGTMTVVGVLILVALVWAGYYHVYLPLSK
jgi:hypothetical protein